MHVGYWKRNLVAACVAAAGLCACSTEEQPEAQSAEPSDAKVETVAAPDAADASDAPDMSTGEAFLANNAKREAVTTTASGLQYEVLASGDGPSPEATDTVTAHYHGTLIDGRVFDSSVQRDEPFTTTVTGVIKGWQEALQLMRVGDKWKVFLPPDLAYGERGAGGLIGPNETLIFEMELLAIEGKEAEAPEEAQEGA